MDGRGSSLTYPYISGPSAPPGVVPSVKDNCGGTQFPPSPYPLPSPVKLCLSHVSLSLSFDGLKGLKAPVCNLLTFTVVITSDNITLLHSKIADLTMKAQEWSFFTHGYLCVNASFSMSGI